MKFFEKRNKNKESRQDLKIYNPKQIYLLTTEIVSNCDDGSGAGPRSITQYYLATKEEEKFYELFSKVEIKYADNSTPGFTFGSFNTPMIKKVEKLEEYVTDPNIKLTAKELFYFITETNTTEIVLGYAKEDE